MTLDADSFVQLCERLRPLGVVKVEGHGFSAVFVPPTQPAQKPFTPPKQAAQEPPIDNAKARELFRQRELGHV